jgi:hypothetical protein
MGTIWGVFRCWLRVLACAWLSRGFGHGDLVMSGDELWTACDHCGWSSMGIYVDTRHVRLAWKYDRQRMRFRRAS